jgi:hypothetical protein
MSDSLANGGCCSGSVRPGTYGNANAVAQITVDKCGRITKVSNVVISGGGGGSSQWTGISSNYAALATDYYIGVNGTGTNVTVTLPLGSTVVAGKTYVIKDESGLITSNTAYRITIATSGSNLIDGSASITVTQSFTALTVFWTGSFWSII